MWYYTGFRAERIPDSFGRANGPPFAWKAPLEGRHKSRPPVACGNVPRRCGPAVYPERPPIWGHLCVLVAPDFCASRCSRSEAKPIDSIASSAFPWIAGNRHRRRRDARYSPGNGWMAWPNPQAAKPNSDLVFRRLHTFHVYHFTSHYLHPFASKEKPWRKALSLPFYLLPGSCHLATARIGPRIGSAQPLEVAKSLNRT
jgi:hypothetical protein